MGDSRDTFETSDLRRGLLVRLADVFRDLVEPDEISYAAAELLGKAFNVSRAGYGKSTCW